MFQWERRGLEEEEEEEEGVRLSYDSINSYWAAWCSGNGVDLYSEGTRFESQTGYRLSWLPFSVVFLSLSPPMSEYSEMGHNRLLQNLYLLTIHNHLPSHFVRRL
jgi:hypothetical protein